MHVFMLTYAPVYRRGDVGGKEERNESLQLAASLLVPQLWLPMCCVLRSVPVIENKTVYRHFLFITCYLLLRYV